MIRKYIWIGFCCLIIATPCMAEEDTTGANVLGMGGVSAADVDDNAAITVNPGLMALTRRYDFHGSYKVGPTGGRHWGMSAMDGMTSRFLWLGLAYSGDVYNVELRNSDLPGWQVPGEQIENTKRFHDLALAVAVPIIEQRLSVGINGGISFYNHDRQGRGTTRNGDVGLGILPLNWLAIGVVGENLLPLDGDRTLGGSAGIRVFDPEIGAFEIDGGYHHLDSNGVSISAGGEKNAGSARLRLGYEIDLGDAGQQLSWGLGFVGDGGTFELGMAIPIGLGESILGGMMSQVSIHLKAPTPYGPPG